MGYRLNVVMAKTLEWCENYDSIEEAIIDTVTMWREGEDDPRPLVLDDDTGRPACVFIPTGTNADECLVVYCVSGVQQHFTNIHYLTNEEGKIDRTSYVLDRQNRIFYHKS